MPTTTAVRPGHVAARRARVRRSPGRRANRCGPSSRSPRRPAGCAVVSVGGEPAPAHQARAHRLERAVAHDLPVALGVTSGRFLVAVDVQRRSRQWSWPAAARGPRRRRSRRSRRARRRADGGRSPRPARATRSATRGSDTRMVSTCSGLKPSGTRPRAPRLRAISPAPITSTTASVTSATTSAPRSRCRAPRGGRLLRALAQRLHEVDAQRAQRRQQAEEQRRRRPPART